MHMHMHMHTRLHTRMHTRMHMHMHMHTHMQCKIEGDYHSKESSWIVWVPGLFPSACLRFCSTAAMVQLGSGSFAEPPLPAPL